MSYDQTLAEWILTSPVAAKSDTTPAALPRDVNDALFDELKPFVEHPIAFDRFKTKISKLTKETRMDCDWCFSQFYCYTCCGDKLDLPYVFNSVNSKYLAWFKLAQLKLPLTIQIDNINGVPIDDLLLTASNVGEEVEYLLY